MRGAGQVNVVLPCAWLSGTTGVAGQPRERHGSGAARPALPRQSARGVSGHAPEEGRAFLAGIVTKGRSRHGERAHQKERTMHVYTICQAMGAGLLGTVVQTILVYGATPLVLGESMNLAALRGSACPLGLLIQVLSGSVCFPLGYVCLVAPGFPGPPVLKGMLWAGLLWGVAECLIAPWLGAGVSSAALGGVPATLRALLGYLAYGATLGGLVGAAGLWGRTRVRDTHDRGGASHRGLPGRRRETYHLLP
jgi:hypothetical protein